MDHVRDTHDMVHACEIANEAEKAIAIRRASGFFKLHQASAKKESDIRRRETEHANQPELGSEPQ
jgi:hypothetical protein